MTQITKPTVSLAALAAVFALAATANAATSVSINITNDDVDTHQVNSDETATSLFTGANWNNVAVRTDGLSATIATPINQSLTDSTGASGAATITGNNLPAGDGFVENSGAANATTGTQGLMGAYLAFGGTTAGNSNETITISGLGGDFAAGYDVYLYFDILTARTYGFTIGSQTFFTNDGSGTGNYALASPTWTRATGTTSGTATANANYALFTGLSGSSFTISGAATPRSVLSGIQIVAVPEPSAAALLGGLGMLALLRRRR
ncbi:MAG: PEP-CTERM sorting domain-containing protein [Verrucomicrobiota bacterium]